MKASKAGFIVSFILAAIFAVIGTVLILLPKPSCPVSIENEFWMRRGTGVVYLTGSLRNTSEETVTVTYLNVKGSTSDRTFDGPGNVHFVIEPNEVFDIGQEKYGIESSGTPESISKVTIKIDGKSYTLVGSDTGIISAALFIFAGVFLVCAIISLVGSRRQQKRYDAIVDDLAKMQCHAVFAIGTYGKKGEAGKAAAKTAASVAGGVLFAALFGIGFYKIYGANSARELILTDGGLYCGNLKNGKAAMGADLSGMNFIPKAAFANSEVYSKKKQVTIRNINTTEYFTFNLAGNSQITPEELEAQLKELATPAPAPAETPTEAPADPFGEVASSEAGTASAVNGDNNPEPVNVGNSEPVKADVTNPENVKSDDDKPAPPDNPFDEIQ